MTGSRWTFTIKCQEKRLSSVNNYKEADPRQRLAFLVGPPAYVSLNWPDEAIAEDAREESSKSFLAAA